MYIGDNAWAYVMARVTHTLIGSRGLTMVLMPMEWSGLTCKEYETCRPWS